jgi:uncharacterized protein (DUF1330 family)
MAAIVPSAGQNNACATALVGYSANGRKVVQAKIMQAKSLAALAVGSFALGAAAVQTLHAQAKPPAFVVAEIAVRDEDGYNTNFLKPAQKAIADHGGKYLAGGYNKAVGLTGSEPANRVVVLQFANMDAIKAWREEGAADMENNVGNKYAKFRAFAVEGVMP